MLDIEKIKSGSLKGYKTDFLFSMQNDYMHVTSNVCDNFISSTYTINGTLRYLIFMLLLYFEM